MTVRVTTTDGRVVAHDDAERFESHVGGPEWGFVGVLLLFDSKDRQVAAYAAGQWASAVRVDGVTSEFAKGGPVNPLASATLTTPETVLPVAEFGTFPPSATISLTYTPTDTSTLVDMFRNAANGDDGDGLAGVLARSLS